MRQESIVLVGGHEVRVVSELLLDPELLIKTQVVGEDEQVLRKQHIPVPAAVVAEFQRRGPMALGPCLQSSHLRFIQRLVATPSTETSRPLPRARAGMLASLVLDADGRVLAEAGEDQVPGAWMQSSYHIAGLCRSLEQKLGLGRATWVVAEGKRISAVLTRVGDEFRACFVDPDTLSTSARDDLTEYLEAM